ncbi:MAG: hypothetical protein NT136_04260 [Candidatus Moranbacteria bacterium]|nr:hypothetical protein [Candidatus Moranbacteria bacterium]
MEKFDFNDEFFALQDKYEKMEIKFRKSIAEENSDIPGKILEIFRKGDFKKLDALAKFVMRSLNTAEVGVLIMKFYRSTSTGDYIEKEAIINYFRVISGFCR